MFATSFDFRGLRCFAPAGEQATWSFLPAAPDLQRDANRHPMVTMVDVGPTAYLLFTASWAAPPGDVEAVRQEIAARTHEGRPDRVHLSYAPLSTPRCSALIGDGHGAFSPVATSTTSGMPPYDSVFNLCLEGERLAHAKAGLRGDLGHLAIEYVAQMHAPVAARATLRANAARLAAWLREHAAADGIEGALEAAIASGVASIVVDVPDPFAGALAPELYRRALARASELVAPLLREPAAGDLHVTVTLEQDVEVPMRAFVDVGALVSPEPLATLIGGHHAAD